MPGGQLSLGRVFVKFVAVIILREEEQLRAMFSDIDADGNGKLSREEIEQAWHHAVKGFRTRDMWGEPWGTEPQYANSAGPFAAGKIPR